MILFMAPPKDFSAFGEVLGGIRLPKQVKEHLRSHEIWARWRDIVGPELARLTLPVELKQKVLEIQVAHQAWAQQLQFLKPSILAKIKGLCRNCEVKDLRFQVGKVEPILPKGDDAFDKKIKTLPVQLSERQEMTLRSVEDPELRQSIRLAMEAASRRRSA